MQTHKTSQISDRSKRLWFAAACTAGYLAGATLGAGCASDDVGHSKTTTKRTVETPDGKSTTTETHEKETKIDH